MLYLLSAVGSALAPDPYIFSAARFIGGLGVGASSVAVPVYIAEITPAQSRGKLGTLYQLNLVIGILVAYISNYLIGTYFGDEAWRWMLGVEIIPAAIYCASVVGIPESPRWLMAKRQDKSSARDLLRRLIPTGDIEEVLTNIRKSLSGGQVSLSKFLSGTFRFPILLAFLVICLANQTALG